MQYNSLQLSEQQKMQQNQQQSQQEVQNGPSVAFQTYFENMPGQQISFKQMQKMQSFQKYNQSGSLSEQIVLNMGRPESAQVDKLKQYSNFIPPSTQQQLLLQDQQVKKKKYIQQNYQHQNQNECSMEMVCTQTDCRQLPRLCCNECKEYLHPQHQTEQVEQFFQRQRERLKRKEGIHKTHVHEAHQVINQNRKKRMKYWKWAVKLFKKVETECRDIESFTVDKLNMQLSSADRRETFQRLTQLMLQNKHPKIDALIRGNPQLFQLKFEPQENNNISNLAINKKENEKEICSIVDQLYILEERERDKLSLGRSASPSPAMVTQHLRVSQDIWEKMIKRLMGANKRFGKRMLKSTRMSILENTKIKITEIQLVSDNTEDKDHLPPVTQILFLSQRVITTIHPNIIQVWQFNTDDFQSFKPKAFIKLENLIHVIAAPQHTHLIILHDLQTIWMMAYQGAMKLQKTFNCPIRQLRLTRLAINHQETILFSSGGCTKKGFYIIYWNYQKQNILRVVRRPFSFPHDGDLLTNFQSDHIFRCNKNSVDIFQIVSGEYIQSITLRKARHCIEKTTILKNFQNRDCFCLSTNYGTFYIYSFEDNRYRLIYDIDNGSRSIFYVYYESQLAEEGFFLLNYQNGSTNVTFQDVNKKILLSDINFSDEITCAKLIYVRNPWKNQLSLIIGFNSGLIRVIIMNK